MTRITLPSDLAARAGIAAVDVREDESGMVRVFDGDRELRDFSPVDLNRLLGMAAQPMAPLGPGKPRKRGEGRTTELAPRAWGRAVGMPTNTAGTLSGNRARRMP